MNDNIKEWITINHQHVPIKEGESKRSVAKRVIERFKRKKQSNNKFDDKFKKPATDSDMKEFASTVAKNRKEVLKRFDKSKYNEKEVGRKIANKEALTANEYIGYAKSGPKPGEEVIGYNQKAKWTSDGKVVKADRWEAYEKNPKANRDAILKDKDQLKTKYEIQAEKEFARLRREYNQKEKMEKFKQQKQSNNKVDYDKRPKSDVDRENDRNNKIVERIEKGKKDFDPVEFEKWRKDYDPDYTMSDDSARNIYEIEKDLYKRAKNNPNSIDPMTENSTDWERLEQRFGKEAKNNNGKLSASEKEYFGTDDASKVSLDDRIEYTQKMHEYYTQQSEYKTSRKLQTEAKKMEDKYNNLMKEKDWLPKEAEIKEQGKSNRKEVSDNIQAHILEYYSPDYTGDDIPAEQAFVRQMDAMKEPTLWKSGQRIAEGGSYLIYNQDMSDFLDKLKINPKGKKFSEDKAFQTYTSLIGRESEKLYNKIKKHEQDTVKNYVEKKNSNVKVSYQKSWAKDGSTRTQSVKLDNHTKENINKAIKQEIESGYKNYKNYAGDINSAKRYLEKLNDDYTDTSLTTHRFISNYLNNDKIKKDRNTRYIIENYKKRKGK